MGIVIGMDEAGYGPNLGPLVITATVWRVPDDPRPTDFWTSLEDVVSQTTTRDADRIHVADSKEVYSPSRGLQSLERSIQTIFGLTSHDSSSFRSLCDWLMTTDFVGSPSGEFPELLPRPPARPPRNQRLGNDSSAASLAPSFLEVEPWFQQRDIPLPLSNEQSKIEHLTKRLKSACGDAEIQLVGISSDVVLTERFNSVSDFYKSKGAALSRFTLGLLRSVWDPDSKEPTLIIGDKHGGRSRYDELIDEQLDGNMIFRLQEGRQKSSYRVGTSAINFQTKAEEHFPVAVASMVCKYVRELSMELFNDFWRQHLPDIKPTKGYPVDAKRFRKEITDVQKELGIPNSTLWRER
ncbi:MAG: hypothetical protein ACKVHE_22860 [Planctomycetales bacterium]